MAIHEHDVDMTSLLEQVSANDNLRSASKSGAALEVTAKSAKMPMLLHEAVLPLQPVQVPPGDKLPSQQTKLGVASQRHSCRHREAHGNQQPAGAQHAAPPQVEVSPSMSTVAVGTVLWQPHAHVFCIVQVIFRQKGQSTYTVRAELTDKVGMHMREFERLRRLVGHKVTYMADGQRVYAENVVDNLFEVLCLHQDEIQQADISVIT